MAEVVLSAVLPVLTTLFEKLSDAALKTIARHKGIDAEIKKWQKSLLSIQLYLTHASQLEITNPAVKQQLNDLQHLAYDIDDVLDGWLTEAMHPEFTHESEGITSKVRKLLPTCCTNFPRTAAVIAELDDISNQLQDLVKQKIDLGLDNLGLKVEERTRPENNNNRRLQTSVVDPSDIAGRQAEKDALVQELLLPAGEPRDKNYSIVPIVGMGGVGKTTLASLLYNEKLVNDHFELRAWVCVSDDFDIPGISKKIFEATGGELRKENEDFNKLQEAIRDHVNGKKFLFVLDDIWSESYTDWKILVGPLYTCAPGSKIIITSRKVQLVSQLVHNPLNMQLLKLSDDDALSLVARHALGVNNFNSHLSLKPFADDIVKKCGGLPLALVALGRLLRTKHDDEEHWKKVSNSDIWRLKEKDGILPALKLSYDDLSAPLKKVFAYCSLFPKDFLFDKEELVLLWMGEGFLHQPTPFDSTEEHLGHEFFDELLSRSFFQSAPDNESFFMMHDLMNDLAKSVAGEFFVRLDSEAKTEESLDISVEMLKYRHMSFVCEKYVTYEKFKAFTKEEKLRTFLATSAGTEESWSRFYLSNKVLTNLLPELPLLRVLSLSRFNISEVPESIGVLRHLRYLNLSRTSITHLPETVCNLYNLQTLILSGCNELTKLPNNFLRLKNLRHLDVRNTRLVFQMLIGLAELKSLQITLSKIIIKSEIGSEIAKVKDFKNLCGNISIVGLEKVQNAIHAHEVNFSQKRISELNLEWSHELNDSRNEILEKEVLSELQPCHEKLIQLKVYSYGGLEFPKWVGDPLFLHLKHVLISGCKRCKSLPPLEQLPSLKKLFLNGLHGVEAVGFELFGAGCTFPSLEILSFKDMGGWKKWSGVVFPCLQNLEIEDCPNLVEVTLEALPSLNELRISKCDSGVLRRLVEVASVVTKLDIRDISGLNDVVWRDVTEYLGAVEELMIESCNEIRYLVGSGAVASKTLVNLRKLNVRYSDKLVSIGEKEEEDNCRSNFLPSLRTLDVWACKNMERCSCPDGIEELSVRYCSSMTVVSFPKGGQEKLRSLTIIGCSQLLERELRGQEMNNSRSSFQMLEFVCIGDWPNLKSINELNCCVHLTRLEIYSCESLESFPDNLTYLKILIIRNCPKLDGSSFVGDNWTSLEKLSIRKCKSMDASLPGWVWPPNLRFLEIGQLKKPMSEWGPQKKKFPTSLVELTLYGDGEDGVSSCCQISHLLPSSLTTLWIREFKKLESVVSMGLQHLTSLQHLSFRYCDNLKEVSLHPQHLTSLQHLEFWICPNLKVVSLHPQHLTSLQHLSFQDCPKIKDLPELLFPSLLSLRIMGNCPGLKERYCKNGIYWPLISYIPCIDY